ncbi:hypothetical protein BWR19_01670 [Halomonas sp. 1513]|nr:hypothetical protein BWR19_01670 [Halomonas sp. 1513]
MHVDGRHTCFARRLMQRASTITQRLLHFPKLMRNSEHGTRRHRVRSFQPQAVLLQQRGMIIEIINQDLDVMVGEDNH